MSVLYPKIIVNVAYTKVSLVVSKIRYSHQAGISLSTLINWWSLKALKTCEALWFSLSTKAMACGESAKVGFDHDGLFEPGPPRGALPTCLCWNPTRSCRMSANLAGLQPVHQPLRLPVQGGQRGWTSVPNRVVAQCQQGVDSGCLVRDEGTLCHDMADLWPSRS